MATKYFSLKAVDQCPQFEPTGSFNGFWFGVAKVSDDNEIDRLTKRGCKEITEEQYQAEVKKKADQQLGLGDYRQVLAVLSAQPAAKPPLAFSPNPSAQPQPTPPPPEAPPAVDQVIKPAAIPQRRKSAVQ